MVTEAPHGKATADLSIRWWLQVRYLFCPATVVVHVQTTEGFFQCSWDGHAPIVVERFENFHAKSPTGGPAAKKSAKKKIQNSCGSVGGDFLLETILSLSRKKKKGFVCLIVFIKFESRIDSELPWTARLLQGTVTAKTLKCLLAD